jgi:predicted SAM-dependent methyltransferase
MRRRGEPLPNSPIRMCVRVLVEEHLAKVGELAGLSVLEVGAGERDSREEYPKLRESEWCSIDVVSGARTVGASVEHLPFKEHQFHLVLCHQVMEHFVEIGVGYSVALQEIHRVLRPQGLLSLSVPLFYHGDWPFLFGDRRRIQAMFDVDLFKVTDFEELRGLSDGMLPYHPAHRSEPESGESGIFTPSRVLRKWPGLGQCIDRSLAVVPSNNWRYRLLRRLGGPYRSARILGLLAQRR